MKFFRKKPKPWAGAKGQPPQSSRYFDKARTCVGKWKAQTIGTSTAFPTIRYHFGTLDSYRTTGHMYFYYDF